MLALGALLAGQGLAALAFGGLTALTLWVFRLWRDQIALATRLLGVSAHGLAANAGIVTTTVGLNVASLLGVLPLGALICFALMNGEAVPNPAREGRAQCVDAQGQTVLCCTWQPDTFGQAYTGSRCGLLLRRRHRLRRHAAVLLARPAHLPSCRPRVLPAGCTSALILWCFLLANQIRVFVTSGAIAQVGGVVAGSGGRVKGGAGNPATPPCLSPRLPLTAAPPRPAARAARSGTLRRRARCLRRAAPRCGR